MLSRLRPRRADDAGITLAELVVAMAITTIVMTLGLTFFVNAEHSSARSVVSNEAAADARVTLDSWTAMLRVADWFDSGKKDRFEEITPTKIVFWADLNNRTGANTNPVHPQKVALMLRSIDGSGYGQLIQVLFAPGDPSTVQSVRQLAFYAGPTGGPGHPIFQPYNQAGGDVPLTNTFGCLKGGVPTVGLCLNAVPANAGMADPTVAGDSLTVRSGSPALVGNPAQSQDSALAGIGGIRIAFTVTDPAHTSSVDFTAAASVNSGWPSP